MSAKTKRCPWCGNKIPSHQQFPFCTPEHYQRQRMFYHANKAFKAKHAAPLGISQ